MAARLRPLSVPIRRIRPLGLVARHSRTAILALSTYSCHGPTQRLNRPRLLNGLSPLSLHLLQKRCSSDQPPSSGNGPSPNAPHLREGQQERHPDAEKDPLPQWPGGVNPSTGERGGPAGPEPTRYGDWERKGRVSDF